MKRPSPIVAIFMTVLIDMLSFGMVIPDLQLRGQHLGATGVVLGFVMAVFSLAQLIFAPFLGRLSDTIGRRKVLIVTAALTVASCVLYAWTHQLGMMIASRVLSGIAAGNLGVAFAYVSDVTPPEQRAKSMGLLGAGFGIGFVLGPPLGAWLVALGHGTPLVLGLAAAAMALVNLVFLVWFLPDAPIQPANPDAVKRSNFQNLLEGLRTPELSTFLLLYFSANFAFSNLESTFFLLCANHFGMSQQSGAYVLAWVGIVIAVTQGALVGPLVRKLGELGMLRLAYGLLAPTLLLVPFAGPWIPMLVGAAILGFANGMANPAVNSLISKAAPADMRGGIFGLTSSLGAVARIAGPLFANALYVRSYWWPYAAAAGLMLIPLGAALMARAPVGTPGSAEADPAPS